MMVVFEFPHRNGWPTRTHYHGENDDPAPRHEAQRSVGLRQVHERQGVHGSHRRSRSKPRYFSRAAHSLQKRRSPSSRRGSSFGVTPEASGAQSLLRRLVVILGRLGGDAVSLGSPGAQVGQAAALAAEGAGGVGRRKECRLAAGGARHAARRLRGNAHRLQNDSSNGTSCSKTRVFCTPSGSRKRTFSAYLLALISGTHGNSSPTERRNICAGFSAGVWW